MPAYRRSVSVPPRPQSTKFSTFDDPSLVSTQPATPVYGRHTGLEGFVPEGFSHTPVANRAGIGRSSATTELIQQLEQVKMEHQARTRAGQPSLVVTSTPTPTFRPPMTPSPSFPKFTLDSHQSPTPPPVAAPIPDSTDRPPSPPSPAFQPDYELHGPNPTNPRALPLPSPPGEGEYLFPDPTGRASLLSPTTPRFQAQPFLPKFLPSLPPQVPLPTSSSPTPDDRRQTLLPAAPKLEPMRYLHPSPPSGRLSAFSPSPQAISPAHELEGPLFDDLSHLPSAVVGESRQGRGGKGGKGRGGGVRSSGKSPSPLRGNANRRVEDLELERARDRIRELEREVDMLRRELLESRSSAAGFNLYRS